MSVYSKFLLKTKPLVHLDIRVSLIFTFDMTSQKCVGPSAMGYHNILLPRTTCRRVLDSTGRRCLCVKRLTFHSFLARVRPHIIFVQYIKPKNPCDYASCCLIFFHIKINNNNNQAKKIEKPTAPGVPRRSPIQVISRPDNA